MDWIALLLATFLLATLIAFFSGVFPYPFGWIIFLVLLIARLVSTRKN